MAEEVDEHEEQEHKPRGTATVQPGQDHKQPRRRAAVRHHVKHSTKLGRCQQKYKSNRYEEETQVQWPYREK